VTLRLIDHLCEHHAGAALHRWPVAGDFGYLLDQCYRCWSRSAALHPEDTYSIRLLPDLGLRVYDYVTALHESAHAVLGMVAGMPLNYAQIVPRTEDVQEGIGGNVNWGDCTTPAEPWAAMVWAGQQAQLRWLVAERLDTPPNRVDVANLGWDDTRRVLEAAAERRLPLDMGWDLSGDLLDEHWSSVERVADALLAAGHLPGEEIAVIARLFCNA
jgi:hypothetical protein